MSLLPGLTGLYQFDILFPGILKPDKSGGSEKNISGSYTLPEDLNFKGDIYQLRDYVGIENFSVKQYAKAEGTFKQGDCAFVRYLNFWGKVKEGHIKEIVLYASSTNTEVRFATDWKFVNDNPSLLQIIGTSGTCAGSGCGCAFYGWQETVISLKTIVTLNMITACTKEEKIYDDLCYDFMGTLISGYNNNPAETIFPKPYIDSYLSTYCETKYYNKDLSMFNDRHKVDEKDYNICACNMNPTYYLEFINSLREKYPELKLETLKPNCLLPSCTVSNFKPSTLNNCPVPQCLNVVNLRGNKIEGDIHISNNAKCRTIIGSPPAPSPFPSPSPFPPPSPFPVTPVPSEEITGPNYLTYGLIGAGILMALIIIIALIFVMKK
jgi:hypothetical protein